MSNETEFFLNSPRSVVKLELLEISHPSFSKVYYIVRNARSGVSVKVETEHIRFFEYVPMLITNLGARDDLESGIRVTFGDLGQIIPKELDRVQKAETYDINPVVIYRIGRSDDLTNIVQGPYFFEIKTLSQDQNGVTFEAGAPGLNYSKTGELYRLDRFPMLRGLL